LSGEGILPPNSTKRSEKKAFLTGIIYASPNSPPNIAFSPAKIRVLIYQLWSALHKEKVKEIPRQQRYANRPLLSELLEKCKIKTKSAIN
jgi:hypothetical protein